MTIPFNDVFNAYYDQFSMRAVDLVIPSYFNQYLPDNQPDYQCIKVISPNLNADVQRWTYNSSWITIGIYRDEGRPATQRPVRTGASWSRSGLTITITDPIGHKLEVGDLVNVYNVNVPALTNLPVLSVINAYNFTVRGTLTGPTSGTNGAYQNNFVTDFYEDYIVFRLLPSFQLVPISVILELFSSCSPTTQAARRTIYNITTSSEVKIPNGKSIAVNYELNNQSQSQNDKSAFPRMFSQAYDEKGTPLGLQYQGTGIPIPVNNVDSQYKNDQVFLNSARIINTSNDRIYVYYYYGIDINDATRGPYFSDTNITIDTTKTGYVGNLKENIVLSSRFLNDEYGNLAIGVQYNNALTTRKQVLPLSLDAFNRPIKSPL